MLIPLFYGGKQMYVLIAYDVSVLSAEGRKRLRQVAKACSDYGQRVQNSLFECKLEPAEFVELRSRILDIIDTGEDSVRFYQLGKNWKGRIEHYGAKSTYDIEGSLVV